MFRRWRWFFRRRPRSGFSASRGKGNVRTWSRVRFWSGFGLRCRLPCGGPPPRRAGGGGGGGGGSGRSRGRGGGLGTPRTDAPSPGRLWRSSSRGRRPRCRSYPSGLPAGRRRDLFLEFVVGFSLDGILFLLILLILFRPRVRGLDYFSSGCGCPARGPRRGYRRHGIGIDGAEWALRDGRWGGSEAPPGGLVGKGEKGGEWGMGGRDLFNVPMNLCRVIKCNAVDDTGRRSAEFAVVGEEIKTLAVLAAFC